MFLMSSKVNHLNFLSTCLDLAKSSLEKGNHPFGAIIVLDGKIITSSENEVVSLNDVTAHAEFLLVQKAQQQLSSKQLSDCTLYTSTEPCPMCTGAIYWAGIARVVFGCSSAELFNIVKSGLNMSVTSIFIKGTRSIDIIGFKDEKAFVEIHEKFW